MEQRWQTALDIYADLAARHPDDPLYALFMDRCRHYLGHPPGKDWNGTFAPANA